MQVLRLRSGIGGADNLLEGIIHGKECIPWERGLMCGLRLYPAKQRRTNAGPSTPFRDRRCRQSSRGNHPWERVYTVGARVDVRAEAVSCKATKNKCRSFDSVQGSEVQTIFSRESSMGKSVYRGSAG